MITIKWFKDYMLENLILKSYLMERSSDSRQRYTDKGAIPDAREDILGAASRVDGFSDFFRSTDGRAFSTAVRDVKTTIDDAVSRVQLERLCGPFKDAIMAHDRWSFVAACTEMYDIVGIKWNESWRANWMNCLLKFFDDVVVGGGEPKVSRFTCYRHGALVIDLSGKMASVYFEHGGPAL